MHLPPNMVSLSHTYSRHTASLFYNLGLSNSLKYLDDSAVRFIFSQYFDRTFYLDGRVSYPFSILLLLKSPSCPIFLTWVANHSAGFGSSCPLAELAIQLKILYCDCYCLCILKGGQRGCSVPGPWSSAQ